MQLTTVDCLVLIVVELSVTLNSFQLMAMVKYQRGSPLALRRKTRKFGPGALVPFTSETEKRVDRESRQRIALWLKGATRCQIWEHRLSNLQVILLFNVSTMK